jgi:hypothetical protein
MLNFGHKFDPSQSIFRCVPIRSQTQKACRRFWATNVDLKKTQRTNRLPNAAEAGMNSGFHLILLDATRVQRFLAGGISLPASAGTS